MPHASILSRLLSSLAPLPLLVACASQASPPVSPPGTSLPERGADRVGTKVSQYVDRFGCLPGPFDPATLPKPVPPGQPGEFIAGYHNHVEPGTPCATQVSHAYNGTFGFNLEDLRGATITSATLLLDRRNTLVGNRVSGGDQCGLHLLVASEALDAGSNFAVISGTPVEGPLQQVGQGSSTTTVSIPVTTEVQRWVLNDQPNYGFVLAPPQGALAKNEDSCTGYWSKPRLQLQVVMPTASR
ncbi:hypothetical protein JQX08_17865 [Pseudomonas sp. UL073]|uniref:Uncharacterized protein n=1 Tax=Zestomonas insulae TaxID=2809017 RepID=A0ABS2IHP8_9GAMM|nr:hypothetical protein [Pseudomonas insulae]MBM7062584.1 hypothetical protein [Pseudomonas insulae]